MSQRQQERQHTYSREQKIGTSNDNVTHKPHPIRPPRRTRITFIKKQQLQTTKNKSDNNAAITTTTTTTENNNDDVTCLTSPSKACSVRTRLASVAMRMLCPSALNFMLFHRASDNDLAFFGFAPLFFRKSSTLESTECGPVRIKSDKVASVLVDWCLIESKATSFVAVQ